ncbi:MAG: glutamate--tRNA ligase [Clostridiales bacterium]|nr:glutamate--tRNA ligase [Clostridiales bacterium]
MLAELIFPDITLTPEQCEIDFPPRDLPEGARVTRFAPSPTGFLHIGGLFTALVNKLTAKSTGGTFLLRIEDTDKKREIEDGVSEIIKGLTDFGVEIDEGVIGFNKESGAYGPYQQSHRKTIYQAIAKRLVQEGSAYPCFCSEDDLNELRARQEEQNVNKGYYGEWAKCRDLSFEEQKRRIEAGEPFVLRLRARGDGSHRITFDDMIKGKIEMPENNMDVVLLKTDGIPTYHFAHAVDDHFMRTTHVIRSDEWIASVPLHIALFKACGFRVPKYAHVSPIMKEEDGNKRKLSKRKDPEAAVSFFTEQGFPKESVIEYLLTLINSNFEDWRKANPRAPQADFPFNLKKMSPSGALFDLVKLTDVSKNVISLMTADEVCENAVRWAESYDPELYKLFTENREYATAIFSIDRGTAKPRKDIAKWSEVRGYVEYFFDEIYKNNYVLPEKISNKDAAAILEEYIKVFNFEDDKDTWFAKMKEICPLLGYAANVKEYKNDPDKFKGHIGDLSTVVRVAITSRVNTPDLHSIIRLLGEEKVEARLNDALEYYRNN